MSSPLCWCDKRRLTRRLADTIDNFLADEGIDASRVEANLLTLVAGDVLDDCAWGECPRCREEGV